MLKNDRWSFNCMMSRARLLDAILWQEDLFERLFEVIDKLLEELMDLQRSKLLHYYHTFLPEIRAIVEGSILYATLTMNNCSSGQHLMGISMTNLTGVRKFLFMASSILPTYIEKRKYDFPWLSSFEEENSKLFRRLYLAIKAINILNFLIFLREGIYPTLMSRLLGLKPKIKPWTTEINKEFVTLEIRLAAYGELFRFLYNFVDFKKIRNRIAALTEMSEDKNLLDLSINAKETLFQEDSMQCSICDLIPVAPCASTCPHVFCFYCLTSSLENDGYFRCPKCEKLQRRESIFPIRPSRREEIQAK